VQSFRDRQRSSPSRGSARHRQHGRKFIANGLSSSGALLLPPRSGCSMKTAPTDRSTGQGRLYLIFRGRAYRNVHIIDAGDVDICRQSVVSRTASPATRQDVRANNSATCMHPRRGHSDNEPNRSWLPIRETSSSKLRSNAIRHDEV